MDDFPEFMKNKKNLIDRSSEFTDDIEGYIYDGADDSQMAFWMCKSDKESKEHMHDFDEYMIVVDGQVTLFFNDKKHILNPGDEIHIPKGAVQKGEFKAGTRTIHAFGKKRAKRKNE